MSFCMDMHEKREKEKKKHKSKVKNLFNFLKFLEQRDCGRDWNGAESVLFTELVL